MLKLLIRRISPYTHADLLLGVFEEESAAREAVDEYRARYVNSRDRDPWARQAYHDVDLATDVLLLDLPLCSTCGSGEGGFERVLVVSWYSEGFGQTNRELESVHTRRSCADARMQEADDRDDGFPGYALLQELDLGRIASDAPSEQPSIVPAVNGSPQRVKEMQMEAFGVRFSVRDRQRFDALQALVVAVKQDKDAAEPRAPDEWRRLVPDDVKARFMWPTDDERTKWLAVRDFTPIAIPAPSQQIGQEWDFYRVFEAIEEGDYDLLGCEMTGHDVAEIQVDPHGYPYGGVGPLIALVEAFGFTVLGVNEYGEYESRDELLKDRSE